MLNLLALLVSALAAVYTANYARWAWRNRIYTGAVGLTLLALAAFVVPAWVMWLLE